jgi:hypothetical protein
VHLKWISARERNPSGLLLDNLARETDIGCMGKLGHDGRSAVAPRIVGIAPAEAVQAALLSSQKDSTKG